LPFQFIATATAAVTTSLPVGALRGRVRGFSERHAARVGQILQTEAFEYLTIEDITDMALECRQEGWDAVVGRSIDGFVHHAFLSKHLVKNALHRRVQLLSDIFKAYFVGIALQCDSMLRRPIDHAVLNCAPSPQSKKLPKRGLPLKGARAGIFLVRRCTPEPHNRH